MQNVKMSKAIYSFDLGGAQPKNVFLKTHFFVVLGLLYQFIKLAKSKIGRNLKKIGL